MSAAPAQEQQTGVAPEDTGGPDQRPASPATPTDTPDTDIPDTVGRDRRAFLTGASALGLATLLERGLNFTANLLAARLGGSGTFGAYMLALTTANNVASYAGAGIGSTATRFSGEFGRNTDGYRDLLRALSLVSLASAAIAALVLAFCAGPMADHLVRQPALAPLLRWAALSAGVLILLECARGFFVGQRLYPALLLLSLLSGGSLLATLPLAAAHGPVPMIGAQSLAGCLALAVCLGLARPLRIIGVSPGTGAGPVPRTGTAASGDAARPLALARRIWAFGLVQLASIAGLNAAGWWVVSLLARSDASLSEVGFFAVASQLRNIAGMLPTMITQSSFALLARPGTGQREQAPLLALATFSAGLVSVAAAGGLIVVLPWLMPALYGHSFSEAVVPAALALATAVVHMSFAPAAARLTVVSLRTTGYINALWTVLVLAAGTLLVPQGGAIAAALLYLGAHAVSSALTALVLRSSDGPVPGFFPVAGTASATAAMLAALSLWRGSGPDLPLSAAMLGVLAAGIATLLLLGVRDGIVPRHPDLRGLRQRLAARLPFGSRGRAV